jgi:hypothetical protein
MTYHCWGAAKAGPERLRQHVFDSKPFAAQQPARSAKHRFDAKLVLDYAIVMRFDHIRHKALL